MLSSITPVGEHARGQRWSVTVVAYVLGSVLGGAVIGTSLGLVSVPVRTRLDTTGALFVLAAVAVVGLLVDVTGPTRPTWHRQVDEAWLTRYRGWVYGIGFGFQLGTAVLTIVTSTLTWTLLATMILSGDPRAGLAVGATFGLVRSLPVVGFGPVRDPATLRRTFAGMERWRPRVRRSALATQGLTALAAVGVAAGAG